LHGLGTADIKGAIAAILEALAAGPVTRPVGVLFSGDEEHGGSCVRAFLATDAARGLERAIVCEPSSCRVGVRHRGIAAVTVTLEAVGGHSSRVDEMVNPVAVLARAAVALHDMGIEYRAKGPPGFQGLNLNVAALDGGIAFNVVPTRAALTFSLRPAPGARGDDLLADAERRVRAATVPHAVAWEVTIDSPSLQARDLAGFEPLLGARVGETVDLGYWTEASRFAERGIDAVVFGPGAIAQAHAADEYVELAELEAARAAYAHVLR
jgi:acetylornithine deacetylase